MPLPINEKVWQLFLRLKKTFLWRFCVSLKLAVFVVVALAVGSAVGTFYESWYDTPTAQYLIYKSWWFMGVQALLGINIFCVAMDRYPWKRRQIPFLMAHVGILMLLWGSVLTYLHGIDGSMMVEEGGGSSFVSFQDTALGVWKNGNMESIIIPWQPPGVEFKPIAVPKFGLTVSKYISRAEGLTRFVAPEANNPFVSSPAVQIALSAGPPMNLKDEMWMWGRGQWASRQLGPAFLEFPASPDAEDRLIRSVMMKPTRLEIWPREKSIEFIAYSRNGKIKKQTVPVEKAVGTVFKPGWMDLSVEIKEYLPQAILQAHYSRSRVQHGEGAGEPAVQISFDEGPSFWLGKGDYVQLREDGPLAGREGQPSYVGFLPQRIMLPFKINLRQFEIEYYKGTENPKEYSSLVTIDDPRSPSAEPIRISMNKPLYHEGFIFYQSSYIPAQPRPTVSIFSVNQDPGRWWKYWGSLLLVMGAILLFVVKYYKIKWFT